ncbi:MAG: hypothetical protein LBT16_00550 [Treponema sp.]|jgi:hypothetical protein|nr:hypothetical protein [Treponema sp.]
MIRILHRFFGKKLLPAAWFSKSRKRRVAFSFIYGVFPALFSLLPFFSCSRTPPKIPFGSLRLVYFQGEEQREERYSFFILPDDDDGIEDLADLYLYHDREGLFWHLTSDDWVSFAIDQKTWIGSHSIAMMENEDLPRGQFRAVLVDKGGEKTERYFTFDAPEDPRFPFPLFTIENGIFTVDSGYPNHYLVCYDTEGNYISYLSLDRFLGALSELDLPANTRGLALWADDDEYFTAALTDVVRLQ